MTSTAKTRRRRTWSSHLHVFTVFAVVACGCLAPQNAKNPAPGSFTDHAGWTEFYPAWLTGPATIQFRGHDINVAANESYATDGASYLYATETGAREPMAANLCRAGERQASGMWVLLAAEGCVWTPHPGVACAGAAACDQTARW